MKNYWKLFASCDQNDFSFFIFQRTVDLRSDTVTRPSRHMKKAIFDAPVGNDHFQDDPSVGGEFWCLYAF